ncbi:hypothetical protein [Pedobacter endophyticus]|uniref:Uncharacterized protein n=1 Tax=Pedobacter endophyticus TaxID=2789740 RepID=A0A7U3Q3A6_9SPHI|nr:hypothetical protein [Pedobacter endophyticus]QPH37692.1 hypothetical protein IZT61_11250 [Pedobacter endophyticus]
MNTILLQITNEKAYKIIQGLEELDIVKILHKTTEPKESLSKKLAGSSARKEEPQKKASDFRGKLNLTDDEYQEFQKYVADGRNEWERDI